MFDSVAIVFTVEYLHPSKLKQHCRLALQTVSELKKNVPVSIRAFSFPSLCFKVMVTRHQAQMPGRSSACSTPSWEFLSLWSCSRASERG